MNGRRAALLGLILVGGCDAVAPVVARPPGPTIAALSPESGQQAAAVAITGTGLAGATSVRFNGTAATFTVRDDGRIDTTVPTGATTGPVSLATPRGTATSPVPFVVAVATGVDLALDGLHLTQATQTYPAGDVPLVKDRSAWVRVFLRASGANTLTPSVRVRFIAPTWTQTLLITAPGASVPTTVDAAIASASWNAAVPAAWVQPGVQVEADILGAVDPAPANDHLAARALDVRILPVWKVTLVPVLTQDGRLGAVETAQHDLPTWVDLPRRLHAMPDGVEVALGASMTSSAAALASDGTGWSTVLTELDAKRVADGVADRYYYGVVATGYSSGVAGLGYIGHPVAIGWDKAGGPGVLAHEVGHNFGRPHSPCGGPAGPDPNYPATGDYANGHIGVPGWDAFATSGNLKAAAAYADLMSYCSPVWVSDYVYRKVLDFRVAHAGALALGLLAAAPGAERPGLLVWGRIGSEGAVLEPAFDLPTAGPAPEPGPYTWEARDGQGTVLAQVPFQAREIPDHPDAAARGFAFVAPLAPGLAGAVQSLHLLDADGRELARQVRRPAAPLRMAPRLRATAAGGRVLEWDAERHPLAMVRDARTGEVRGFGRGGLLQLQDAPADLEVHLSDGAGSVAVR